MLACESQYLNVNEYPLRESFFYILNVRPFVLKIPLTKLPDNKVSDLVQQVY